MSQRRRSRRTVKTPSTPLDLDGSGAVKGGLGKGSGSVPLVNNTGTASQPAISITYIHRELRAEQYRLQRSAAKLLGPESRVNACHRFVQKRRDVQIVRREHSDWRKARYTGLVVCSSVWNCPVCAARIARGRQVEVGRLITAAANDGVSASFVTYTARHSRDHELRGLVDGEMRALRHMKSGRWMNQLRWEMGYVGQVRSVEVTWGPRNGWHPHAHELWLHCQPVDAFDLQDRLTPRWLAELRRVGLDGADGYALDVQPVNMADTDDLEKYMAKVGSAADLSLELTGSHRKIGRKAEHKTPMQLLHMYAAGDTHKGHLWREYADVYQGRKQMVWSPKLDQFWGVRHADDMELAEVKPDHLDEVLGSLDDGDFFHIDRAGMRAMVLDEAEKGGWPAVRAMIDSIRSMHESEDHKRLREMIRGCLPAERGGVPGAGLRRQTKGKSGRVIS